MGKGILIQNYRDDDLLRSKFYKFIATVFPSADFCEWYDKGFWADEFIPVSLLENDRIISNVSISKMQLLINGMPINGIQIGAVGTIPGYTGRGLSRYLMEYVLDKYKGWANLFFLFANETVTDYYPKFGFRPYNEVVYNSESNIPVSNFSARKLNINNDSDINLIINLLKKREALTKLFGAVNYDHITKWHILNIYRKNIYYLEDEDVIFIVTGENKQINIVDVIYNDQFNIAEALPKILDRTVASINFHFPPDILSYNYDNIIDSDTLLFIRGEPGLPEGQFKFPVTAQT